MIGGATQCVCVHASGYNFIFMEILKSAQHKEHFMELMCRGGYDHLHFIYFTKIEIDCNALILHCNTNNLMQVGLGFLTRIVKS